MDRFTKKFTAVLAILLMISLMSCGGGNNSTNSFSNFNPEIINNVDAFQFQITDAQNVTTSVDYLWENTGTQATINHSTTTNYGSATIEVFDADSASVYSSGLLASANDATASGTAGTWRIRVTFVNFDGTANFRAEKL